MESVSPQESKSAEGSSSKNPFFAMLLFSASIFILTILAMVAMIFSDPRAPVAKFFEAHAGRLIAAEVTVTLIVGFCALAVDRIQSRRKGSPDPGPRARENSSEKSSES